MDRRTFIGHGAQAALAFGILPHAEALDAFARRTGQPSVFAQLREHGRLPRAARSCASATSSARCTSTPSRRRTWAATRTARSCGT